MKYLSAYSTGGYDASRLDYSTAWEPDWKQKQPIRTKTQRRYRRIWWKQIIHDTIVAEFNAVVINMQHLLFTRMNKSCGICTVAYRKDQTNFTYLYILKFQIPTKVRLRINALHVRVKRCSIPYGVYLGERDRDRWPERTNQVLLSFAHLSNHQWSTVRCVSNQTYNLVTILHLQIVSMSGCLYRPNLTPIEMLTAAKYPSFLSLSTTLSDTKPLVIIDRLVVHATKRNMPGKTCDGYPRRLCSVTTQDSKHSAASAKLAP